MANAVTENLMSRLSPKWVEHFRKLKSHEHRVAWVRNYPIQTGEEEAIIQLLVDKLDPALPSVTRVSQVRAEMQQEESKGGDASHKLDTPEGEKYWQDKLDEAQRLDDIDRKSDVSRRHEEIKKLFPDLLPADYMVPSVPATPVVPTLTVNPETKAAMLADPMNEMPPSTPVVPSDTDERNLITVAGFGKDTINKFMDKGIICTEQLFDLTYSQALAIAKTPLVLAKIKDKFKKDN
jgi:hypothetical protein